MCLSQSTADQVDARPNGTLLSGIQTLWNIKSLMESLCNVRVDSYFVHSILYSTVDHFDVDAINSTTDFKIKWINGV